MRHAATEGDLPCWSPLTGMDCRYGIYEEYIYIYLVYTDTSIQHM